MSQNVQKEFGKWRSFLWPVHAFELKKLIPMLVMAFAISFNYTVLRDAKDAIIVTAPSSGAEAIPFLKVWGVVPSAFIFMLIYAKLSNTLSKEKLFYATIMPFIVFFALFPTFIYPNRELLHPEAFADWLQGVLPAGMLGLVACVRNWTYAMFYIMAELWGSAVLSLLFWGFANDITKVSEAKRFYTVFGLGLNVALLCSGPCIVWASQSMQNLPPGVDPWQRSLNYLMGMVVFLAITVVLAYRWMQTNVLTDPRFYNPEEVRKPKKSKPKLGVLEGLMILVRSRYLGCLALLVIGYGITINLVEVTWKSQLKMQYPNTNDYVAFMGKFSFFTGLVTIGMLLFVGGNLIRLKGWKFAAMVTPTVLLITGGAFFSFVIFRENLLGYIAMMGTTPLMMAVIFGAAQNIMSKSSKYSLFDPTKEIAYIPLDPEEKVKGKAAIDVVGARLGKSGGSLIQQGLLVFCGGIAYITPYVAGIFAVIIVAWMLAVGALDKMFRKLSAERDEEARLAKENQEGVVKASKAKAETAKTADVS